jgi:hypothetical protein
MGIKIGMGFRIQIVQQACQPPFLGIFSDSFSQGLHNGFGRQAMVDHIGTFDMQFDQLERLISGDSVVHKIKPLLL